jgi:Lar family restriction alleviation protein
VKTTVSTRITRRAATRPIARPCPFCGGTELEIREATNTAWTPPIVLRAVRCRECEAVGPGGYESEALAILAWDRREPG